LYLDFDPVFRREQTTETYLTAYGELREDMLSLIRDATVAANGVLSRAPRDVGEDSGAAYFAGACSDRVLDYFPEAKRLRSDDDLAQWMDDVVGRDVMSFGATAVFLFVLRIYATIFGPRES
jgi:hypothetical protein